MRIESRRLPGTWPLLRSCVASIAIACVVLATVLLVVQQPRVLRVLYAVGSARLPANALNAGVTGSVVDER